MYATDIFIRIQIKLILITDMGIKPKACLYQTIPLTIISFSIDYISLADYGRTLTNCV